MAQQILGTAQSARSFSFFGRLHQLLAATDQAIAWYGAHRAWPANEPAQVKERR